MLRINYNPQEYVFTSSLPSEITITTDAASVAISIVCGSVTVFSSTFYPYKQNVMLYDTRFVIENYLKKTGAPLTTFYILAVTSEMSVRTTERTAIFSNVNIAPGGASSFIKSKFLTTQSSYTIPFEASQMLTFILIPNVTMQCYVDCLILPDGETTPRVVRLEEQPITSTTFRVKCYQFSPRSIHSQLKRNCKLLQFSIHRGVLSKTFYVTGRMPNLVLYLRNEFNCVEYIYLTCVIKSKIDLDRSTATCLGTTSFYDDKSVYEYEVETSMLTFEEATRYSRLLLSHDIRIVDTFGVYAIIVSDISSELSDADNALNSIKFKFRYGTKRFHISLSIPNNIFTDPYHRTFD